MNSRIVALGLHVVILSVSAFGSGFMGPPTAELSKGQWSIGYNYMQSSADLGEIEISWNDYNNGVWDSSGIDKDTFENIKNVRHYATFGYGISDSWQAYFQFGVADLDADMVNIVGDVTVLDFSGDFAWGWGTRFTLYDQGDVRWGTSLQMNWIDTSADVIAPPQMTTVDFETMDLLIAFGPTVDMGGWKLYGGPFYYSMSGDYTENGGDSGNWTWDGKADIESQSNFGGFIGAQVPLSDNTEITAEISFTGDSWAVGTGITWRF